MVPRNAFEGIDINAHRAWNGTHGWRPAGPFTTDERQLLEPLPSPHIVIMEPDLDVLETIGHRLHRERLSVTMIAGPLDMLTLRRIAPDTVVVGLSKPLPPLARLLVEQIRTDAFLSGMPIVCSFRGIHDEHVLCQHRVFPLNYPIVIDDLIAAILGELTSPDQIADDTWVRNG